MTADPYLPPDPASRKRRLLADADELEKQARHRREHANYLRQVASEADYDAVRLEEAAADYRLWAKARKSLDAAPVGDNERDNDV